MRKFTFLLAVMAVFWGGFANAGNWYVATTGVDTNDGSSGTPFLTIAKAITSAAATGDVINIAAGTYTETNLNPGDKSLTFQGAGKASTFIQAQTDGSTSPLKVFTCTTTITAARTYAFNDLTIKNGYSSTTNTYGTGLTISTGTSYTLTLNFSNVDITANKNTGSTTYGAVYLAGNINPTFNNCYFYNNSAGYAGGGAAIYVVSGVSTLNINNCYFLSNTGGAKGGAIGCNTSSNASITIKNSTFKSNAGGTGSGTNGGGALNFTASTGTASLSVENSTFNLNTVGANSSGRAGWGGAIYFKAGSTSTNSVTLNHCTITGNSIKVYNTGGGDGVCVASAGTNNTNLIINNSIIVGNTASGTGELYPSQVGTDVASQAKISTVGSSGSTVTNSILGVYDNSWGVTTGETTSNYNWNNKTNAVVGDLSFGTITTDATPVFPILTASIAKDYISTNKLSPVLIADQLGNTRSIGSYPDAGAYEFTTITSTPVLSFASSSVSKSTGDAPFTNTLTSTSGGTVTYSSNNTSVATVNASTGLITIVGAGTATISASQAANSVYTASSGSATFSLSVGVAPTLDATTATTAITANSASSGGSISSDGGTSVLSKGVCWSTSQNPTVSDSHTTDGTGTGSFTSSITGLSSNTLYYVRAYATNSVGTGYGAQTSFTTTTLSNLSDYFQSRVSGNWATPTTWNSSTVDASYHVADLAPGASATKATITVAGSPITITTDIGLAGFTMENGSTVAWNYGAELTKTIAATGTIGITASATQDYSPVITGASIINITLGVSSRQSAEWSRASFPASSQVNFSTSLGSADLGIESSTLSNVKVDLGATVKLLKGTNENSDGSSVISIGALSGASTSVINSGQVNSRTMAYNIGASNTDATFAGQINNQDVSRVLNINKVGSGNWTLTNANTGFTNGSFNVNAGTVTLNSGAGLGTVPVTVASGATLKGAGSIAGATTVNGTLAGKLSFGSTLALAGTTNLSVSGFNTGEYDVITTAGGTNGGTLNITITASTPAANTRITLISSSPARTGSFASVNIKDGSGNPLYGYSFNAANGELGYLVPPTTQPTNASASNTLATTTSLSWTAGDGAKYLVLYSTNSDVATAHLPVDHTAYTVGSQIAEGYYVGSVSGGTTASITGLTPNTLYYFAVFSYNDYNGTGIENYVTASPATTSVTTLQASFDTDYFKTTASGNWSAISTWVSSTDNSSWHVASLVPNAASTASKVLVTAAASPLTITSDIGISGFDMENGSNVIWNHAAELTKTIAATGTIGITASATQDYSPVITGASTINITLGVSSRQSAEWSRASFPASSQVNFSTSLGSADLGIEPTTLSNVKVDLGANIKLLKGTNEASDGSTVISIGALSGASTSVINSGQQNGRTMAYNIGALNTDATFAGQIYNQNIARVLNVNKVGTGTWTLTNANTGFTNGSLNINDGTVILGTGAGIGSATASVSGNGTLVIPADAIFPNAITVNVNDNGAGHLNIPNGSTIASFSIGLASAPTPGSSFSVFGTTDPATITYTATTIAPGFSYNATTGVVTYNGSTVSSSDTTFISVLSTPSNATLHVDNATAILKIDQNATFRDLTVAAGAKLSVATGKTLNVSTLNLQSTASGTATYVNKGRATITTANVQQWLTTGRNWYISSPLRHTLTSSLTSATSVQYWDEPSGTWKNAADTLISGKGYISVATSSTGNILFNGTLNDDTVIVHLTRTKDAYKEGFNLVGNPYPSYLSWDAVEKTNVDPTVWYRTKNSAGSYKFGTYNTTSQLGTNVGANDTDQKDIVTGNIPPLQAFWVRVLPAGDGSSTTGTLLFKNTMRSHKSAQLQGDAQTYNDGLLRVRSVVNSAQQVVRLQVSNGTNSDEAIVLFNANAQNGLDDYDSYKMSNGSAAIPEIFTTVGTSNLAINGLNSLETANVLPLGFATGQANTFTIKASQVSNLEGYSIFLLDNKLGTEAELTNGEAYTFTSDITNTTSRFSVVLRANGVTTGTELRKAESGLAAYCNAKKQIVVSGVSLGDNIGVFNSLGQKVMEKRYTSQPMTLQGNFTPGVYLVVVNNAIQKVLVK